MPSILRDMNAVGWVAGKNFVLQGKSYKVGDEVPEINEFPRLEVFVRNRFVIPVVETTEDLPFQFRHVAMTRQRAERKLGMDGSTAQPLEETQEMPPVTEEEEELVPFEATPVEPSTVTEETEEVEEVEETGEFNPADHSINQVMDYLEENPDEITSIYEMEEQGRNRSTLLAKLDDILNKEDTDV